MSTPTEFEGWSKGDICSPSSAQSPQSPISQDQPKLSHSVSQPLSHSFSNQLTSGNKLSNTPPHKLLLETSFTSSPVTSPQQRPDLRIHALAHALSWELVSALEEQLLTSGFPQGYQIGCPEIPSSHWSAHAPLASPETMSDSSSISSRLSIILKEMCSNNSKTPSPPLSPVTEHKTSIKNKARNLQSSSTPPPNPVIHSSPKIAPKNSSSLGQGYCFYIDTPATKTSVTGLPLNIKQTSRTPEEPVRFSNSPPPQYITLSPIVPNDLVNSNNNNKGGHENESKKIRETLDELFRSIDKPPFVIDLDDEVNTRNIGSPPCSSEIRGHSAQLLDSHSIGGFLDDGVKVSEGSRRSSLSLNRGHTISQELTTSQMSRDSGYAERWNSGRQSNGSVVDETKASVEELDISEVSIDCRSWGDTQQEYGRGNGPPNPPYYVYCGSSPEHQSGTDGSQPTSITSQDADFVSNRKINDIFHPLHVATPLLHSLKSTRKSTETSL